MEHIGQNYFLIPSYKPVLTYIREHPGVAAREIAEATNSKLGTTRKRLLRLQAEGVIRAERFPRALIFYVNEVDQR